MADPRLVGPQTRSANLSDLMKAQGRASLGEKVNFCPFGCQDDELDDRNYCPHLVGFTVPGDDKQLQPLLPATQHSGRRVDGSRSERVRKDDRLVRITVCSRVYRPGVPSDEELDALTRPDLQPA